MSRIDELTDGAEWRSNYWDAGSAGAVIDTGVYRSGTASWFLTNGGFSPPVIKNLPTPAALHYDERAVYLTSGSEMVTIVHAYDVSSNSLAYIQYNGANGLIYIYRGDGALLATSTLSLDVATWYRVETKLFIDNAGEITVKVDGVQFVTYSGDTQHGANVLIYSLGAKTGSSTYMYLDDMGGDDASWVGDLHIEKLTPNANGSVSEWVGSDADSVDNYLLYDEAVPDDDTTYITSSTPGDQDAADVGDYTPTGKTITAVWSECIARGTVGGEQIKVGLITGAEYLSAAKTLLASYGRVIGDRYTTNPNTASAWVEADLDAIEWLVEAV